MFRAPLLSMDYTMPAAVGVAKFMSVAKFLDSFCLLL
jgi:hypothetical protein